MDIDSPEVAQQSPPRQSPPRNSVEHSTNGRTSTRSGTRSSTDRFLRIVVDRLKVDMEGALKAQENMFRNILKAFELFIDEGEGSA